jgi:hypothetical protein
VPKTLASVALVQVLSEVHQLRLLTEMIAMTAGVCVVSAPSAAPLPSGPPPSGPPLASTPPAAPSRVVVPPLALPPGTPVRPRSRVVSSVRATPERVRALAPGTPLIRRTDLWGDVYEPDEQDSIEPVPAWQSEDSIP